MKRAEEIMLVIRGYRARRKDKEGGLTAPKGKHDYHNSLTPSTICREPPVNCRSFKNRLEVTLA